MTVRERENATLWMNKVIDKFVQIGTTLRIAEMCAAKGEDNAARLYMIDVDRHQLEASIFACNDVPQAWDDISELLGEACRLVEKLEFENAAELVGRAIARAHLRGCDGVKRLDLELDRLVKGAN